MAENDFNPELREFIARHIRSVEQVEILQILGANPDKSWTMPEVVRVIQSSEQSVTECLEYFCREGFLARPCEKMYRLQPDTPAKQACVTALLQQYRERRVRIIEVIYSRSTDRIQDFANAFRFRKDK